jgi:hypothetical protein
LSGETDLPLGGTEGLITRTLCRNLFDSSDDCQNALDTIRVNRDFEAMKIGSSVAYFSRDPQTRTVIDSRIPIR